MKRLSRRLSAAAIVAVAGLAAGVGTSGATTAIAVTLSPFVSSDHNALAQVTYGGSIGYHLVVRNNGSTTVTHAKLLVRSDHATFLDASDASCAAAQGNPNWMVCTPFGGTLAPGGTFSLDFRFTAPGTGSSVTATAYLFGSDDHGSLSVPSDPVTTHLTAGGSAVDTFLRVQESAHAGGPQSFSVTLPHQLLGNPFAVAVGIQNQTGTPICGTCLPTFTTLTIPSAHLVTQSGNPFYDGAHLSPFPWSMSASYTGHFQLHGVWHVEDNGHGGFIPSCASLGGGPTAAAPLCYTSLTQDTVHSTVSATGLGLENGSGTFG